MFKTLRKRKREEIEMQQRRCKHPVSYFTRDLFSDDPNQYIEICVECHKVLGKKWFKPIRR